MFLGLTNKQAIIGGIVITLVVILSLFIFLRTRAAYTVPDTVAAQAAVGTTQRDSYDVYTLALDACTTTYATDLLATPGSETVAGAARELCIDRATFTYVAARCPPLSGNHTTGAGTPHTQWGIDKTNIAKMYTKVLNDLNGRTAGATQIGQSGCAAAAGVTFTAANGFAAGSAYDVTGACTLAGVGSSAAAPLQFNAGGTAAAAAYITAASVGATPTALTPASTKADVDTYENAVAVKAINLSRNADIAAATRKYIATVCTDFYVADGLTANGLNAVTNANAAKYKELYFPDVTTSATAVARITAIAPLIKKWLPFWIQRAATFAITNDGRTSEGALLGAPTATTVANLGAIDTTTPIVAMSASTVATYGTKAMTAGASDPSGLSKAPADNATVGTMQTMKNWHLARMYGAYSCWYLMDTDARAATVPGNIGVTVCNPTAAGSLTWAP
jgi:hypothetical protein